MEKVLAYIHVTKYYESLECILLSYHHKCLHLCVVSSQRVSCHSMIFCFHRQHVLHCSKLILHHLILQVYLRDMRHKTRRLGQRTSPQRHCLQGVHHSIEQSIPSKKKKTTVVRSRISHSQSKTKDYISPSMCFSTSAGIDNLAINGFILLVEAFIVLLDHFSLYFFYKQKQTINVTTSIIVRMQQKYIKNSLVELLPPECTIGRGLKGHFPYDPSSTL
jgi:hypothetical protein